MHIQYPKSGKIVEENSFGLGWECNIDEPDSA